MKKSRMGSDPLGKKPPLRSDSLEWISDSRSEGDSGPADERQNESIAETQHPDSPLKEAIILSGGGAVGAFEIGVMKALIKGQSSATAYRPLHFDVVTGTSVGAFNAACMAQFQDPGNAIDYLENLWLDRIADHPKRGGNGVFRFRPPATQLKYPEFLARRPIETLTRFGQDGLYLTKDWIQRAVGFFQSSEPLDNRFLELMNLSSFVSTQPLLELVRDTIHFEDIRRAAAVLKIVATDWETGEATIFGQDQLSDDIGPLIILASTALPGFFPPVAINGRLFCDGGVVMNTPLSPAIKSGAHVLHMIYMDPDVSAIPLAKYQNTLDTFDRMLTIQFAMNINRDIEEAERVNTGLQAMEQEAMDAQDSHTRLRAFTKTAHRIRKRLESSGQPYKKLVIHRYHPRRDLSDLLGLLNFGRPRIQALIDRGVQEAVDHDCTASGCIIPA